MNSICIETGWLHDYAYERPMNDIYDVLYRDLEYFPAGSVDHSRTFNNLRAALRK